jgi:hypothetical protein
MFISFLAILSLIFLSTISTECLDAEGPTFAFPERSLSASFISGGTL